MVVIGGHRKPDALPVLQLNPADASFCEGCGTKLELLCPACKASVSPGARFCKKCGTAIGPAKAASTTVSWPRAQIIVAAEGARSGALEAERKTVTALFADIKGSTELMEKLDPEEARAIIDPALKLIIEAVQRYDGYVVQSTGDGISRCSVRRWPMRTIRSARCMPRCVCRKN